MSLITISSGIGCKSDIIAQKLSEKLKLEMYNNKRIETLASKLLKRDSILKVVDEEAPGFLQRLIMAGPEEYFSFTESIIYQIAERGKGIIVGHAAQMLLRNFDCTLKVLVHASLDDRIKNVMKEKGISKAETEKLIKQSDSKQNDFYKFIFKENWESTDIYDIVVNISKIDHEKAYEIIIDVMKNNLIKECSIKTLKNLKKLSLEKRVAAVLMDNSFNILDFKISANEKGYTKIVGFVNDYPDIEKIKNIVEHIDGVKKTNTEFQIKIPYHGYNGYAM
jgi:CMP/dCMP kinase